ncbi:putative odorant receptor 83c [Bradysia coprophila]|uniref:putative odorant receptor 83c n=1 Tax=Bradysia coprophila TaxID=38358 RepID=UPI00187DCCFE|nr:putative odorant receptor 83c [Bradysia coprophila]
MEPAELFHLCIFRWIRKLAQLVGVDLFVSNYEPNVVTYCNMSVLWLFLASCLWTIYSHEFDEKVICCSALAFNCQGIVKYFCFIKNNRSVKDMLYFCSKIYRANTAPGPNKQLLAKSVKIIVFIFKNGMVLLLTTAILALLRPGFSYIVFGKLDPILPTYLPGVDEEETYGYVMLATLHTYIAFIFVTGTAGCDLLLMTQVIHLYTMTHIFRNAVDEFNALIERNTGRTSRKKTRQFLRNLILMHIDYARFTKILKEVYSGICLIQITMSNTIMIVLLYVILMVKWFPAYFLMAVAFFQVFEFSVMGTVLQIANDNMFENICNISIVDLPIDEQKKVILMTALAQHPHNLTIGGFQSLNVETFVDSMKNTYSVGMLLVNTQVK